jgi:hypothetical protein
MTNLKPQGIETVAPAATSRATDAAAMWPGYRVANPHTIRRFLIDRPLGRLCGFVAMIHP